MASFLKFPYRFVFGAVLFASIFHHVSALNIKYCSSLNTAQTGASKSHPKPLRIVNTDQFVSQIPVFTSPMDSATTSASPSTHSRFYKIKHAGVRTMHQAAPHQRAIAAFNVLATRMICAEILRKICSDTTL